MRNLLNAAVFVGIATLGSVAWQTDAKASVVGSSLTCEVINAGDGLVNAFGGAEPNCDAGPYVITDTGPTIAINGNGTVAALEIMFMGGWIDITTATGLGAIGFTDEIIRLSGFVDSTGDEPIISAFSESIADPDFDLSDITLEGGVLEIDLAGVSWLSGEAVGFDVSVPLPLPALLLLTGLVGLGYMGRRKAA
ncbi:MAG: hypothetical protein AAFU49_02435 [Pseudomonadota bacterium]